MIIKYLNLYKIRTGFLLVVLIIYSIISLPVAAGATSADDGTVQPVQVAASLPKGIGDASSAVHDGYIYLIGGVSGTLSASTVSDNVYYSKIDSNGMLSGWQTTTSLPQNIWGATTVVSGDYIYVIGGAQNADGSGTLDTVFYAEFNSDGTLGSWQVTTSLPHTVYSATSEVHNGYVYEIGGYAYDGINTAGSAMVYYAKINADGTLDSWQSTTSLPEARVLATSIVNNGYLYEIGGMDAQGFTHDTVYYAKINADGTLGIWQTTTSLLQKTYESSSVVKNGYLYEIGGVDYTNFILIDDIQYAKLNGDGTLGDWQTTESLSQAVLAAASETSSGYLYVIGGAYIAGGDYVFSDQAYFTKFNSSLDDTETSGPSDDDGAAVNNKQSGQPKAPEAGFSVTHSDPALILIITGLGAAAIVAITRRLSKDYKK